MQISSNSMVLVAATAVVALAGISAARADVIIYQDNFNRGTATAPVVLNGSSPALVNPVDGGVAGATWTSAGWSTNGSDVLLGNSSSIAQGAASLPFTPLAGQVYTLSETEAWTNPTANMTPNGAWIALGYSTATGGGAQIYQNQVLPEAWMLMRFNASSVNPNQSFYGGTTSNEANIGANTGQNTIALVLNTQAPQWTVNWFVNGNSVRTATFASSGNQGISTVSFGNVSYSGGNTDTTSAVTSFTLSDVPEPATLGLLAMGGLGLLMLRRRKIA